MTPTFKRIDPVITRNGNILSRLILPLPDYCRGGHFHFTQPSLDYWFTNHPEVCNAIQWESPQVSVPYSQWPEDKKDVLRLIYPFGYPYTLTDPPINQTVLADADYPVTSLNENDAWMLYINYVAQSLIIDFWKTVPWKMDELTPEQLTMLLDSRSIFTLNAATNLYDLIITDVGYVTPAPPDFTFQFLKDNALIGKTRIETIGLLLGWCRENMGHSSGGLDTLNAVYQWQYRGFPPVSRIIGGTPNNDPAPGYNDPALKHRTAGCHGTNGFLKAVLRVLNIPVKYQNPPKCAHATPYFPSENKFLSHGDDPYNSCAKTTPRYPAGLLLIDHATYDAWFPVTASNNDLNIGRQVSELDLIYLSNYLLHAHCADIATGHSHAASGVYAMFSRWYSVADLEAKNLWTRMDDKIATFGGCSKIP